MAAIWLGLWLAEKRSAKHGISVNDLNNIVFYPLIGYILGGRILFALENLSAFAQNPKSLISLNLDLFDPIGGLVDRPDRCAGVWATKKAVPVAHAGCADAFFRHLRSRTGAGAPGFGQRLRQRNLPALGDGLWGATRHPSQVYEILASLLILGLLWFQKTDTHPGIHFLTFAALTSGTRLFLEAFRGDSSLILGGLRAEQILAWVVLAVSLYFLDRNSKISPLEMATRSNG